MKPSNIEKKYRSYCWEFNVVSIEDTITYRRDRKVKVKYFPGAITDNM